MIASPNLNPQMYLPPPAMLPMQDYVPQMALPYPIATPPNVIPVYNSIPYNPVYGNYSQQQKQMPRMMPDISTVKIELNGLEPPKVPGYNDYQSQYMPYYPVYNQPQQTMQPIQQYQNFPQMQQPVGMAPVPSAIPPSSMIGAMSQEPQYIPQPVQQVAPPPANYIPQQIQQSAYNAPPSAIDQVKQPSAPQAGTDQDLVKPLLDALSILGPKPQGATQPSFEDQGKAIQTIAMYARQTDAANQLIKKDPNNQEIKQTKEKVDQLIKPNLIKEETFLGLADIAVSDTSKLSTEDRKKADENRIYSMWTLAMLQKSFKQEMNEEAKKINIPPISMNEVPGIVQLVNITQKDSNPKVREAGIAALVNLADPQDKKDMETMKLILGDAQKDSSEEVKNAANEAVKMYTGN